MSEPGFGGSKNTNLCSCSGIVPRVKQSGGPDKPARTGHVRKGCNRMTETMRPTAGNCAMVSDALYA
jgi:hypothetical protein